MISFSEFVLFHHIGIEIGTKKTKWEEKKKKENYAFYFILFYFIYLSTHEILSAKIKETKMLYPTIIVFIHQTKSIFIYIKKGILVLLKLIYKMNLYFLFCF